MPKLETTTEIELEDLDAAPSWLIGLLETRGYLPLDLKIFFTYGSPATRTDPEDPGELEITLHYRPPGADKVEIERLWLTPSAFTRIESAANDHTNASIQGAAEAKADAAYDSWKERDF